MIDKRLNELKQEIRVCSESDTFNYKELYNGFFEIKNNFKNGWCKVKFNTSENERDRGWINQDGEFLEINGETKFYIVGDFSEGFVWIQLENGLKYTFINPNGKDICGGDPTGKFENANNFYQGLAWVVFNRLKKCIY